MRKICIINQKGGVGKTTTTISIAAGLSRNKKKVLIIDLDAQGNLATSLNVEYEKDLYHVLTENADVRQCTKYLGKNLDIIPSKETLTKTESLITNLDDKELLLRDKLSKIKGYDYVLIDCPPSLGLLNQNAMLYANEAFLPVSTDHLGFDALEKMTGVIDAINKRFSHNIRITKVIPTMYDKRIRSCTTYLDRIRSSFYEYTTHPIRINSKLKEAPSKGMSIFSYAPASRGAKDYAKLVKIIINEEDKMLKDYPQSVGEPELVPLNSPSVMEQYKKKMMANVNPC